MKGMKQIIKACPMCCKKSSIMVTVNEFMRWHNGMRIQDAMPMQSATVRETLISGICSLCQDSVFDSDE